MKRYLLLLLLLISGIILNACTESKASVNLSEYPEAVQKEEVSLSFYEQYLDIVDKNGEYSNKATEALSKLDSTSEKRFLEVMREHDNFLEEIKLSPSTEADYEINKALQEVLDGQKFINYNLGLYTSVDDKEFEEALHETLTIAIESNREQKEQLNEVLTKYGIQ